MNFKNGQNLIKKSNANVLQIFAFAFHIVGHNVKDKPKCTRKSSQNVSEIPLIISRTNSNEDTYCLFLGLANISAFAIRCSLIGYQISFTIVSVGIIVVSDFQKEMWFCIAIPDNTGNAGKVKL